MLKARCYIEDVEIFSILVFPEHEIIWKIPREASDQSAEDIVETIA